MRVRQQVSSQMTCNFRSIRIRNFVDNSAPYKFFRFDLRHSSRDGQRDQRVPTSSSSLDGHSFCSSCRSRRRLEVGGLDGCQLRRVQGRSARARFVGQPCESRPAAKLLPQAVSAASGIREALLSGTAWNRPGARGCEASPLHPKAAAEWYLRKHAGYPRWDTKWTGLRIGARPSSSLSLTRSLTHVSLTILDI